jgi:transposase
MTPEEALSIYHAGPDVVFKLLCELSAQVELLQKQVAELQRQVQRLKDQLAKNSRNSSKPPSSDGFNKPAPKSLRPRGKRKTGGQKGHPGSTLTMVDNPDHTILYPVDQCQRRGRCLTDEAPSELEKRQVFDIPPIQVEVTEHQAGIKPCPHCGYLNKATFPEQLKAPVQYGPRLKAIAVYLRQYQLLPYNRTRELLSDLFSTDLSEGTLTNIIETCSESLQGPVDEIRRQLAHAPVVHFDETGSSVEGTRHWLHATSTAHLTYYEIHPKRGAHAMDQIGILPNFKGRAIHDFWKPYFTYDCDHGLCNAHHLRELTFLNEQHDQRWAKDMIDCLLDIKLAVDAAKNTIDTLFKEQIQEFEQRYQNILDKGYHENPLPKRESSKKKRGRRKKSKARNLLERLDTHRKQVLAFMYDFNVPFDNNLVERDLRMAKVQQKISGTFRSPGGATAFCRIRGYISTARKNALNAIEALGNAFAGKPYIPLHDTS